MPLPQPGIFALGTRAHHHLEFDLVPGTDDDVVCETLGAVTDSVTTVTGVNLVIGLGPDAARRLLGPGAVAAPLVAADDLLGVDDVVIPGRQHDVWVWLHGAAVDDVLDAARAASDTLAPVATVATEQPSYVYGPSLDLTGFEDGTENPPLNDAATVACVPDGRPGARGSVALLQRWVHDLAGFAELGDDAKEAVIGRTLADSDECDPLPDDAHVARMVIEDETGDELEVFRRSTAFGTVTEGGLVFVAFSQDQDRLARMLDRMIGAEDGIRDQLTRFSTATRSAWYFVPPLGAFD